MMRRCWWTPVCCLLLSASSTAFAQTNLQLWGNVTLDWVKSDRLTYEFDIEAKVLVCAPDDEPAWRNLDLNTERGVRGEGLAGSCR
jgi:hypothetical protein